VAQSHISQQPASGITRVCIGNALEDYGIKKCDRQRRADFEGLAPLLQMLHVSRLTAVMPVVIALEAARHLFDGQIDQ
jgi:hypothetical protein